VSESSEVCVDCGKNAPETDTNYTLISPQYGWRLSRKKHADGTYEIEWRCRECWRARKEV
jgi:hypothetical protein